MRKVSNKGAIFLLKITRTLLQQRIKRIYPFFLITLFVIFMDFHTIDAVTLQIPQIIVFVSQQTGQAPLEVNFDASQSFSSVNIQTYLWDFGDGKKAAGRKVKHTFFTQGQYSVRLTITDDSRATANAIIQISVSQLTGPLAAFSYSIGSQSFEIEFDPRYSMSELGISAYYWNFGDSSPEIEHSSFDSRIAIGLGIERHVYQHPGFYLVRLRVVDISGASHTCERGIEILRNMPIPCAVQELKGTTGGAPSSTTVLRIRLSGVTFCNNILDADHDGLIDPSQLLISQFLNPVVLDKLCWLMIANRTDYSVSVSTYSSNVPTPISPCVYPPISPPVYPYHTSSDSPPASSFDLFSGFKIDSILFSQKKCRTAPCAAFLQQAPTFATREIFVAPSLIPPQNSMEPQVIDLSYQKELSYGVIGGGVDDSITTLDVIDANASRVNPYGFVTLGPGETLLIKYLNCPDTSNYYMYLCAINEEDAELVINFFDENIPIEALIDHQYLNFPPIVSFNIFPEQPIIQENIKFDASASRDPNGEVGLYEWSFGDGMSGTGKTIEHKYDHPGDYEVTLTVLDDGGSNATYKKTITIFASASIPQEPTSIAPALDPTVVTNLFQATEFLYTGINPVQRGMNPNVVDSNRVAVLQGQIKNQGGNPLAGVKISILNHPEYGWTMSRENGIFDMVVNGGSQLTVQYEKSNYLIVQRLITVPWKEYAWLPDIVMIQPDQQSTKVYLSENSPLQVAQGTRVTDGDGSRLATLVFPKKTTASLVLPNGSTQPASTLTVRITEYSVGQSGPKAMPAELPPAIGYTYAFEARADEAIAIGAEEVRFDQPIIHYVENFLNFPIGLPVPTGYYDRKKGIWIPSKNGVVVMLLDMNDDGVVDALDSSGDEQPDDLNNDGSYTDEVEGLIDPSKYPPNKTFWRVPITHFSPWDCNWPYGPPSDAEPPTQQYFPESEVCDPCKDLGRSVIEYQNQVLSESVPVIGTPFNLNYRSDRVVGHKDSYTLEIPLSGQYISPSLKRIELEILIAGQRFTQSFQPLTNQKYSFTWNGRDVYGRTLQGSQLLKIRLGYVYNAIYQIPSQFDQSFGSLSGVSIEGNRARQEITLWQEYNTNIGLFDAKALGFGGWTIGIHHSLDSIRKTIYLGDGRKLSNRNIGQIITTVVGGGDPIDGLGDGGPALNARLMYPRSIASGADGSIYIADKGHNRIRRVGTDGIITTVVGNGTFGSWGDGGAAIQSHLGVPEDVAIAPDGNLYIVDSWFCKIKKVSAGIDMQVTGDTDEIITTIAGGGTPVDGLGDGGLAINASLNNPRSIALGTDGSIYIADYGNNRIRRVGTDGIITTVAGTGKRCYSTSSLLCGDGGSANRADLYEIKDLAVGTDGSLFIADICGIYRISPDGIIKTVAGHLVLTDENSGNGELATETAVPYISSITIGADGNIYFSQNHLGDIYYHPYSIWIIRKIESNGIINAVTGNTCICAYPPYGDYPNCGDGGLALNAAVFPDDIAFGLDGTLYILDGTERIRKIVPIMQQLSDQIFIFDSSNRHIKTIDANTGSLFYNFEYTNYNGIPYLTKIVDRNDNIFRIERDFNGKLISIVSPFDYQTNFTLNNDGYIESITNPANETIKFIYKNDGSGLLESLTDSKSNIYVYEYDSMGRIAKYKDPFASGGVSTLVRTDTSKGYIVSKTTAMGRTNTYQVEALLGGGSHLVNKSSCCKQTELTDNIDGTRMISYADGTTATFQQGPDPRWGMSAPITKNLTIKTPSGLTLSVNINRNVTILDQKNPLSLLTLTDILEINSHAYKSTYDAVSNKITRTSPEGRRVITALDAKGRIVERQVTGLAPINYTYDSYGRLKTVQYGSGINGRVYTLEYDTVPSNDYYVDRLIDPETKIIKFDKYDSAGRLKTLILKDSNQIIFNYDANGNIISLTPPGRLGHIFTYTTVNKLEDYIPPNVDTSSSSTHYEYNPDRQLDLIIRPDGKKIDFVYDTTSSQMDKIIFYDGMTETGSITFTYYPETNQSNGRLFSITNSANEILTFTYDGFLGKSSIWTGTINGSVEYTYNNNFNVESETINGSSEVRFLYDDDGLLKQAGELILIRDNPNAVETKNGLPRGTTLSKVATTLEYNTFGELKDYVATFNETSIPITIFESHIINRDKLGRVKERTETINSITDTYNYDYDLSDRIWKIYKNGTLTKEFKYDANGNRLIYKADGSLDVDYDDQDRLLRYGDTTYTYSTNGDLETKTDSTGQTKYTYNIFGNLSHVDLPNNKKIDYVIDGSNRRIGKKVNGTLTRGFLYRDQFKIVAELDGNNTIISRFVYGLKPNVPDYMIKAGTLYQIISDHLGSVRLVINTSTFEIAQRIDYDEYGNVLNDTNPGFQPFGFVGGLYDYDTGLIRFGARDYDPTIGRWTARDPILFASMDTNLYVYANNDPVNKTDFFGLVDLFYGGEFDIALAYGFTFGTGLVLDTDNLLESGNYFFIGSTEGLTFGYGIVAGICEEIEGYAEELDINSPWLGGGVLLRAFGVSLSMGPGLGVSTNETFTITFSVRDFLKTFGLSWCCP